MEERNVCKINTDSKLLVDLVQLPTKRVESSGIGRSSGGGPTLLERGPGGGELVSESLELVGVGLDLSSSLGEVLLVS